LANAILPAKYNFVSHETVSFRKILSELEYQIIDNPPRETECADKRVVQGVPTPDLLFNSPSLIEIDGLHRTN
ncbi:MAG: hypothetical protein K0U38_07545, partial [Epsilonproteobacteria bacterium]|nr:hypothetical protein [Campylobacterota bacterium]